MLRKQEMILKNAAPCTLITDYKSDAIPVVISA